MHDTSPQALDPELLGHIGDLNRHLLELLVATARGEATGLATPLVTALRSQWLELSPEGLRRLAGCPYLLLELAVGDTAGAAGANAGIHEPAPATRHVSVAMRPGPVGELLRRALLLAWHFAHTNPLAVRITLGFSAADCAGLAALPLPALEQLAAGASASPRLRWEDRLEIWQQLLLAAGDTPPRRLRQLQLRGLQLLAGRLLQRTGT
jgi:hypothetical protein